MVSLQTFALAIRTRLPWLLIGGCFFPFLALVFFNHPSSDDFPIFHTAKDWDTYTTVVGYYKCWSSRYTALFLMSLNPYVFGSLWGYKLSTVVLCMLLFFAFRYFQTTFFPTNGILSLWPWLALLWMLVSLDSLTEGFYYMGGALFYQPGNALWLWLLATLCRHPPVWEKVKIKSRNLLLLGLQGIGFFLLAGCNEIGMGMGLALSGMVAGYQVVVLRKWPAGGLFLFLSALLGAILVLASPATFYRMEASQSFDRNLEWVLKEAVWAALNHVFSWSTRPVFLVFLLLSLLLPVSDRIPLLSRKQCIVLSIFALLGFVLAFTPSFKGEGMLQARTSNALQLLFGSLVLVVTAFWKRSLDFEFGKHPNFKEGLVLAFLVLCPFLGNSRLAWYDLVSGEAKAYSSERDQREAWMKAAQGDSVWVSPVSHKPKSLFHGDLGDYPDPWYDNHFAGMFGKKSVLLSDSLHPPGFSK